MLQHTGQSSAASLFLYLCSYAVQEYPILWKEWHLFHENAEVVAPAEGQFCCANHLVLVSFQSDTVKSGICTVIKVDNEDLQCTPNVPRSFVAGHFGEFLEQFIHHYRMPNVDLIVHVLERIQHWVDIMHMKTLSITRDVVCPWLKSWPWSIVL